MSVVVHYVGGGRWNVNAFVQTTVYPGTSLCSHAAHLRLPDERRAVDWSRVTCRHCLKIKPRLFPRTDAR